MILLALKIRGFPKCILLCKYIICT